MQDKLMMYIESGFFSLGSFVLVYIASKMREMSQSIENLNLKLSVYIEKIEGHTGLIMDHEKRIREMEKEIIQGRK